MGLPFPHVSVQQDCHVNGIHPRDLDTLEFMTRLNAGHPAVLTFVRDMVRAGQANELPNGGRPVSQTTLQRVQHTAHLMTTLELATYANMATYAYARDPSLPWQPGCHHLFVNWNTEIAGNCALLSLRGPVETRNIHILHLDCWRSFAPRLIPRLVRDWESSRRPVRTASQIFE